jgi:hypothetical protein
MNAERADNLSLVQLEARDARTRKGGEAFCLASTLESYEVKELSPRQFNAIYHGRRSARMAGEGDDSEQREQARELSLDFLIG